MPRPDGKLRSRFAFDRFIPSCFRGLVKRLRPLPLGDQTSVPEPFDPFSPIHDAPRQVNLPNVLDQDVMIPRLVGSVRNVELLPETCVVHGFDDLEHTPWALFFGFCEACKQCIMSGNAGLIDTLEWFNMASRAQLEQSPDDFPAICYVVLGVLEPC
ncbi:hypothetical protein VSDG_08604 [Cytospora chrysosperma]|uniref:Uncharacterized protein n=1 Tax=Cytospora chrysosperma TaxID=252740 RepID=A0A423VFV2_CYTCH|nr:hypothetical protein VSDG_08604 [Valsa sordida]